MFTSPPWKDHDQQRCEILWRVDEDTVRVEFDRTDIR
jgi:hypothetical protein